MWQAFYRLPVGATFHTGISTGAGICSQNQRFTVYRKDTKSTGKVVEVHGWGNTRDVGYHKSFAPGAQVWPFDPLGKSTP